MLQKRPRYLNAGGRLIDLQIPRIMGILNVTPDSFYKNSRYITDEEILSAATRMVGEGADIIDVGGYSSRPGAREITPEEEKTRVIRAILLISNNLPDIILSVDTFRAEIAREAICRCGAHIINDISGGDGDKNMFSLVGELKVPYIMMHMQGSPRTMQNNPSYDDIVSDILTWFGSRIADLNGRGVKDVIIDPGFGFGKTIDHNFELLKRIGDFSIAGLPLMVGLSRKSMIWKSLHLTPDESLNGTTALNMYALMNGVDILRVHDVKEAVELRKLFLKIKNS